MSKSWTPLTEKQRLEVIKQAETSGHNWTSIGQSINRSPETCKKFYQSYKKFGTIYPKQGRPPKINDEVKQDVVKSMKNNPKQSLSDVGSQNNISKTSTKTILNDNKIKYYQMTPIPPLDDQHKTARLELCDIILSYHYLQLPPIIFTDESTVCENLNGGGIWREYGHHPEECFYSKEQKPLSVMIWGGIGPRGFRTRLFYFQNHVNSQSYMKTLLDNNIFGEIEAIFDRTYVWQQDNAPSHTSYYTQGFLSKIIPKGIKWPPRSPDLSPIEQVWAYIKKKLAGMHFKTKEQLFEAIEKEWINIPNNKLHNYYSSFWARCYLCRQYDGEALNGKWGEVKQIHNQYRTQLFYKRDENTGEVFINEH